MKGTLNQKQARRLLERNGWERKTGGKHKVKMVKGGQRPVTLPHHRGRDYSPALAAEILRQAGLK